MSDDFHTQRATQADLALRAYVAQPTNEGRIVLERLQASAERYDRAIARREVES